MNKLLKLIFLIVYLLIPKLVYSKETRKIVAIVDTGMPPKALVSKYLCKTHHYDLTGYGIFDAHGHGTNITGIIASNMNVKTHCILVIKWWHTEKQPNTSSAIVVVRGYLTLIRSLKPSVVNLSLSGEEYLGYEKEVIQDLVNSGTNVVAAAGNEGTNLDLTCSSFPACYKIRNPRLHIVGSGVAEHAIIHSFSNRGAAVTDFRNGIGVCGFGICLNGTSQATAILTSEIVSGKIP